MISTKPYYTRICTKNIDYTTDCCEWCDGECGSLNLEYYKICFEDGSLAYKGWFSPPCLWLAEQARDAVENDNS